MMLPQGLQSLCAVPVEKKDVAPPTASYPYDPNVTLEEMKNAYILSALEYHQGNKRRTAQALGVTIKTLYTWMHTQNVFERYRKNRTWRGRVY